MTQAYVLQKAAASFKKELVVVYWPDTLCADSYDCRMAMSHSQNEVKSQGVQEFNRLCDILWLVLWDT